MNLVHHLSVSIVSRRERSPGLPMTSSLELLAADMAASGTLEGYLWRRGEGVLLERYSAVEISDAAFCASVVEDRQRRRILRRLRAEHQARTSPVTYHVDEAYVPCCFEDLVDQIEASGALRHFLTWLGQMDLLAEFTPQEVATAAFRSGVAGERHRRRIARRLRRVATHTYLGGPPGGLFS